MWYGQCLWASEMPPQYHQDFFAIAVLKIVDAKEHELVTRDHTSSVKVQLNQTCRKRLRLIYQGWLPCRGKVDYFH